jgi:hypothetical protein
MTSSRRVLQMKFHTLRIYSSIVLTLFLCNASAFAGKLEDDVNAILKGNYSQLDSAYSDQHEAFFAGKGNFNTFRVASWFLKEFQANREVAVIAMLKKNPKVLLLPGCSWIDRAGCYAMPAWQHIRNMTESHDEGVRKMSFLTAENAPADLKALFFLQFGLTGGWKEHIERAYDLKVRLEPYMVKPIKDLISKLQDRELQEYCLEKLF